MQLKECCRKTTEKQSIRGALYLSAFRNEQPYIASEVMYKNLDDAMICNESAIYKVHFSLSYLERIMLQMALHTFPPHLFV